MSIIIKYPKQFSKEYKDIIIILSKLSELKSIKNLPINANFITESKEIEKTLKDNQYYESFLKSNNSRLFHNLKIVLLKNYVPTKRKVRFFTRYHFNLYTIFKQFIING